MTFSAPELLNKAATLMAERGKQYDKPEGERSMAQTVAIFNLHHGLGMTEAQAKAVGAALDLPEEAVTQLQVVPYKGSLPTAVPTDPLIYRFYELISVYGTTFKSLIHEEFGDGIMSAIDFNMDLTREPDPKGDRVKIVMSGKFLPYRTY